MTGTRHFRRALPRPLYRLRERPSGRCWRVGHRAPAGPPPEVGGRWTVPPAPPPGRLLSQTKPRSPMSRTKPRSPKNVAAPMEALRLAPIGCLRDLTARLARSRSFESALSALSAARRSATSRLCWRPSKIRQLPSKVRRLDGLVGGLPRVGGEKSTTRLGQ